MPSNTLRGKKDNVKIIDVSLKDCAPMSEVERQFPNHLDHLDLKRVIGKDGYERAYPIRIWWDKDEKVYLVFDGNTRLKVMNELKVSKTIPAIDESYLTREQAIEKGIKANRYRSQYNCLDLARSLMGLGKQIAKTKSGKTRPYTLSISDVAERSAMSTAKVSQYWKLLKLPEDVQNLIGTDRLKFSYARELTKLLGTQYEDRIPELAQRVIDQDMTVNGLAKAINAIKQTGVYSDDSTCPTCKKIMPRESFGRVCIDCIGKLHSGELDVEATEKHNDARRRYLKLRAIAERNYPSQELPNGVKRKLDELYGEWNPKHNDAQSRYVS